METAPIKSWRKCSYCEYGAVYATREVVMVEVADSEWLRAAPGQETYYCERHKRELIGSASERYEMPIL